MGRLVSDQSLAVVQVVARDPGQGAAMFLVPGRDQVAVPAGPATRRRSGRWKNGQPGQDQDQLRRRGLRGLGSVAMPVAARSTILVLAAHLPAFDPPPVTTACRRRAAGTDRGRWARIAQGGEAPRQRPGGDGTANRSHAWCCACRTGRPASRRRATASGGRCRDLIYTTCLRDVLRELLDPIPGIWLANRLPLATASPRLCAWLRNVRTAGVP
jgi:hypothetical protein